jgi:hypothetical protein
MDQAVEKIMAEINQGLVPYDEARFGKLPKLLQGA